MNNGKLARPLYENSHDARTTVRFFVRFFVAQLTEGKTTARTWKHERSVRPRANVVKPSQTIYDRKTAPLQMITPRRKGNVKVALAAGLNEK